MCGALREPGAEPSRSEAESPPQPVTNQRADRPRNYRPVALPDPSPAQQQHPCPPAHHHRRPTGVARVPGRRSGASVHRSLGTAKGTPRRCGRSTPPTGSAPWQLVPMPAVLVNTPSACAQFANQSPQHSSSRMERKLVARMPELEVGEPDCAKLWPRTWSGASSTLC